MSPIAALAAGVDSLIRRVLAGDMPREDWWCAMRGASKYLERLAAGDVAPEPVAAERAAVCSQCPYVTREGIVVMGLAVDKLYCGPAFRDRLAEPEPTCGCLVGITVDGKPHPGGKTRVGSERCPQTPPRW